MSRNFVSEFKNKIRHIDKSIEYEGIPKELQLYNIHKRSLPAGVDKVVLVGVTLLDTEMWKTRLKTHLKNDVLYYYDVMKTDATIEELDIFYNTRPVTKEGTND